MEDRHFINYSNIFLNMKVSEDTICDLGIPEHCLLYVYSGQVDFREDNHSIIVSAGECAFIRKGHRIKMTKYSDKKTQVYQSILLNFPENSCWNITAIRVKINFRKQPDGARQVS